MSIDLIKALKIDYHLIILEIQEQISLIFEIILLAIKNEDCQIEITICQNMISVGNVNINTLQQNNLKHPKYKWNDKNKRF